MRTKTKKRKNTKKNIEKKAEYTGKTFIKTTSLLSVIFLLIIFSISLIRTIYFFGITPQGTSYLNYRLILNSKDSLVNEDNQMINKRIYFNELFYILINHLTKIFPKFPITYYSIIFAILSFIVFSAIVAKISNKKERKILIYSGILFLTSPELIFLTLTLNPAVLTLLCYMILIYLLLNYETTTKKYLHQSLIVILTIITSITNPVNYSAIFLLGITFYFFRYKQIKRKKIYLAVFFISLASFFISNIPFLLKAGTIAFHGRKLFVNPYFIELGAEHGIRIIDLLLTIIGLSILWSQKNKYYITSLLIIFIIYSSIKNPEINPFIIPLYALLGGIAFYSLVERKWNVKHLKTISLFLLLISAIIFTTIYILDFSFSEPTTQQFYTYKWLSKDKSQAVVFSDVRNSFFIELISNKKVILDENVQVKNATQTYLSMKETILSRDINFIKDNFDKWNVKYIIIDDKIRDTLGNKEDGIIFVLKNSNLFKLIYSYKSTEIYKYINPKISIN